MAGDTSDGHGANGARSSAGQTPSSKAQQPGIPFELNDDGGIETDSALSVPQHPHVFAVGDTAAAERRTDGAGAAETGGPWPATAQVPLHTHTALSPLLCAGALTPLSAT